MNEVIEWATNMAKNIYEKSLRNVLLAPDVESAGKEIWAHIDEVRQEIMGMSIRNTYVRKVAMKFGQDLQKPVVGLIKCLEAYLKFLGEWQHAMADNIAMPVDEKAREAEEYQQELEESANDVLEEAAKIKTRYVG